MSQNNITAVSDPQAVANAQAAAYSAPATMDDLRAELAGLNARLAGLAHLVEQNASRPAPVRVVDFNMSVGAIIALLFKYLIASFVVGLVVFVIGAAVAMVLVVTGLAGFMTRYGR